MSSIRTYIPVRKVPNEPGKYFNHEGYILIWTSRGNFVLEHRHIAEQALGRTLKFDETVHHIDGVRSNNAKTNLLVCSRSYHELLHRRTYKRYGRWHLPGVRDPYKTSMHNMRKGLPLNSPNVVNTMYPPSGYSDTVDPLAGLLEGKSLPTKTTQPEGVREKSLSSVASILRRTHW